MTEAAPSHRLVPGWLSGRQWSAGDYTIVALRQDDIEAVRRWRNEQLAVLRQQRPLSRDDQQSWFDGTVVPTHSGADPSFLLVSMLESGRAIAYGGLTNIDWDSLRAEISFLVETERAAPPGYAELFGAFLSWLVPVAFDELGLHRLFTETYAFRSEQIEVLENHGFVLEGRLREHVRKEGRLVDSLIHALLSNASVRL